MSSGGYELLPVPCPSGEADESRFTVVLTWDQRQARAMVLRVRGKWQYRLGGVSGDQLFNSAANAAQALFTRWLDQCGIRFVLPEPDERMYRGVTTRLLHAYPGNADDHLSAPERDRMSTHHPITRYYRFSYQGQQGGVWLRQLPDGRWRLGTADEPSLRVFGFLDEALGAAAEEFLDFVKHRRRGPRS